MIENNIEYTNKYQTLLKQIINNSDKSNSFIGKFIKTNRNVDLLIKDICSNNYKFWDNIYLNEKIVDKNEFLISILKNVEKDEILKLNSNNNLSKYISNLENIEDLFKELELEKIKFLFLRLNIVFTSISYPNDKNDLYDYIYEENLYKINDQMIELFMQYRKDSFDLKNYETRPYTTVFNSDETKLKTYIQKSIQEYVTYVFLNKENISEESEKAIIDLLNRDLVIEQKQKIVDKYGYKFELSSMFNDNNVLDYIFLKHKIRAYWENIANYYYKYNEININLLSFLNFEENYKNLSMSSINDSMNDEKLKLHLSEAILINNNISDDSYKQLFDCCDKIELPIELELSENKYWELITAKYLSLSLERYLYLKEKFPSKELYLHLLIINFDEFMENFTDYSLNTTDLIFMIKSPYISIENITELFNSLPSEIVLNNEPLCNILSEKLSNNKELNISYEELSDLIKYAPTTEIKVKLLNTQITELTFDQISDLFYLIEYPYSDIANHSMRPSIPNTEDNLELAHKLDQIDFVSSINVKDNSIKIFTYKKKFE